MTPQAQRPGQGRVVLLLIAGIPLTMILAASWLWYFVVNGDLDLVAALGTANNGELVTPPRGLQEMPFLDDAGVPYQWSDLEARWTLLVPVVDGTCDNACERRIWLTRQIHIALGREFNRVRRAVVSDAPLTAVPITRPDPTPEGWPEAFADGHLDDYLAAGHAGVVGLQLPRQEFVATFAASAAPPLSADAGGWYLVDPGGWVMMRFPDSLEYKAIISDLKFLLKNSGG